MGTRTVELRTGTRRTRRCVGFALLAAAAVAGCHGSGHGGFIRDSDTVQVVSALVGGKNVFIPSTIVVTGGSPTVLSFFNTTDTPHGFRIDGIDFEAILPSREEYRLELPALEGGNVYQIRCQLHPPHRTAELVVLPGR